MSTCECTVDSALTDGRQRIETTSTINPICWNYIFLQFIRAIHLFIGDYFRPTYYQVIRVRAAPDQRKIWHTGNDRKRKVAANPISITKVWIKYYYYTENGSCRTRRCYTICNDLEICRQRTRVWTSPKCSLLLSDFHSLRFLHWFRLISLVHFCFQFFFFHLRSYIICPIIVMRYTSPSYVDRYTCIHVFDSPTPWISEHR